ncbi:MAG: FAD-dependent oxidoreductase, partial [Clostridiales bacterium]|nr:FAD-dependent oxidoreductase [Clostridiales bacterium]
MKKLFALLLTLCVAAMGVSAIAETYTAEAPGFGGPVNVTVTIEDGAITDVQIAGDQETAEIGGAAIEPLAQQIMDAQSAEIDGVTGASFTSNAVKLAAAEAIAQASGGAEEAAAPADGEYTAEGSGFSLVEKVPVTVTIEGGKIAAIDASEDCAETTIMLRTVKQLLIPRIIEAQSVGVDAICGATATSNAIKGAVADCLGQALEAAGAPETAINAFYTTPDKPNAGVEKDLEADVLVIGMGGAGATAAVSAAEAGLKVIALEKAGKVGGTSSIASEPMAINPKRFQEEHNNGEDYIDAAAMKEAWLQYTTGADGTQKAKEEVVDVMFEQSGDALDWLTYDHGFTFGEPRVGFTAADVYLCRYNYVADGLSSNDRRIGAQGFYDNLMQELADMGGELYLETEGRELVFDEETGAVTGAIAVAQDGTTYNIKAKAVVLATGGFAGNPDMVDQYLSQNKYFDFTTPGGWMLYGSYQNDGKMIASAIAHGAGTWNIDMPAMVHNTATPVLLREFPVEFVEGETNPVTGRTATHSINDIPQIMSQAANILVVGNNGKRFVDEASMGMLGSWAN